MKQEDENQTDKPISDTLTGFHCGANVMILTGATGYAFFLQETLLGKGLAQKVDIVSSVAEAEQKMQQGDTWHMIIIDLEERWEAGMQIGYEWYQAPNPLRLFLLPPDMALPCLDLPNIIRTKPATLAGFVNLIYELCQDHCGPQDIIFYDERPAHLLQVTHLEPIKE